MPDFSRQRSEYLRIMMGDRHDALAPYRPDQINDLGDTSFDVASLSDDDINTAIKNMAGTDYQNTDLFKSLQTESENRKAKAEEESKPKSWLESIGDFFSNIGTSITEGIFNVVDDIWDFGIGVAGGLFGGGWFGAKNDFTDWVANAMTDDRWVQYATKAATQLDVFDKGTWTNEGGYWSDWSYDAIQQQQERDYEGMDWLHKGGNFVGEIIPSLVLAYFTGGTSLGAQAAAQGGLAFARSYGRSSSQALEEGASFQQSAGYGAVKGAISGALSAGLTYAGGTFASRGADSVLSRMGNKVGDSILAKTGSTTLSAFANNASKFIVRVAGDSGEAAVLAAIEPALQQIYNDKAWYNAYGTEENRKAYGEQIGKAALTAAAFSAVTNVVRDVWAIHKAGGAKAYMQEYEKGAYQRLSENEILKSMSASEQALVRQGASEWQGIQRDMEASQQQYEMMKSRGASDADLELFVGQQRESLMQRVDAYNEKYGKVFTKLSAKAHPDVLPQTDNAALANARSAAFERFSSMTSKSLKADLQALYNGRSGISGLLTYTEGSAPVETANENGQVVAKPKDYEQVQSVLAAIANDPENSPTVIALPLKTGTIRLTIESLNPAQAKGIAFLRNGDFKRTETGAMIAPIGDGKSIVISQQNGTAQIVATPTEGTQPTSDVKPVETNAEPSIVKEAAQAGDGKVYSYASVSKWEDEVNDSLIKVLKQNGVDVKDFGTLVGAKSNNSTLKQVFNTLNLGSKKQIAAIRDAVKSELFSREFTYDLPDSANQGKALHQTLSFNDLLPELSGEERAQLLADFDAMFDKLVAGGKDSRVAVLKDFISKQKDLIGKYRATIRDTKIKKDLVGKLSRTRSVIKERVTGDYDYGKVEERDLHTINMLAKPIASFERSGGTFKATPKTLEALLEARKYYVPENYDEAGSIVFSTDVKEALDHLADLITQDVNKPEISVESYQALWDYQSKVLDYERELSRIETTERKPSAYAASAELSAYDMSLVQKALDIFPREFGGAAGELFMRFGYGEITKKFVIEPIKAYGRSQDAIAKAVSKLGEIMPKKGFHSKKVVGEINGVKITRGQLITAYINTFLATDNFADVDAGGIGIRAKNGSIKWATKGDIKATKSEIERLISEEDKQLAEDLFHYFNGYLQDWYIEFEKNVRHKVDVERVKNYFPKFKERDYEGGVDSVVSNKPLFRYEKSRTGDKSGLIIANVMDIASDYIKTIAKMQYLLPVSKAATALRNSKTESDKILATEIKDKYGRETLDLLDKVNEGWFKSGVSDGDNIVQKAMRFFMHGYATAKLSDVIRPVKNYFSYITSNVDLAKMPRAAVSLFSEGVRSDVSWLIDNEIYELKYRFDSGEVVEGNVPTVGGEIRRKVDNVLMFPVKGVDWLAMKDGLYAVVAEARHRGIDVRSKQGAELVHNIYAMFYLSNVGSTPLHKSKMSDGALRYVFDVLAGAKRAQVASFAMQGSLFHQFKGVTQAKVDADVKEAKVKVAAAEEATKKAVSEYDEAVNALESARQRRDELVASKAEEKDITAAKDAVKTAKARVKAKRAESERASEDEAKARSEQRRAENAQEGYAQYKFAGGKRIPLNILAKAMIVGGLTTLVAMTTKWLYGKKNFNEYTLKEIGQDIALNSFVNWMPVVSDVSGALLKNYEIDAPSISMMNEVISAVSDLISSIQNGKLSGSLINGFIDILEGITGLPLATVKKYVYGIIKTFNPAMAYQFNNVFYNSSSSGLSSTAKSYAEKNDISTAADLYVPLYGVYKTGEIDRDVAVELAKLVHEGHNPIARNIPDYITNEDGDKVNLTDEQKAKFGKAYGGANNVVAKMLKAVQYKSSDSATKAKLIKKVYDLYYELAKYETFGTEPDSRLGKLLAYCGGDYDVLQAVLLIQRNSQLAEKRGQTKSEQAIRLVNQTSMTRPQKLLTLYLMGYGVSAENKQLVRSYLTKLGFTKKQAEEFIS